MCHVACVGKSLCEQSVIFFRRENIFSFAQNIPIGSYTAYHNFRVDAYRNVNPPPNIVKHSNERIKFRFYLNAFFVLEYCLEHFRPRKIRTLILSIVFCSFVFAKKKKNPFFSDLELVFVFRLYLSTAETKKKNSNYQCFRDGSFSSETSSFFAVEINL